MSILAHADIADHIFSYLDRNDLLNVALLSKSMHRAMQVLWKDVDEKMLTSLVKVLMGKPLGDQATHDRVKWYCGWILKMELNPYGGKQTKTLYYNLSTLAYALGLSPFPHLKSVTIDTTDPSGLLLATRATSPTVTRIYLVLSQRRSSYDWDEWRDTFAVAIKHIYQHCKDIAYLGVTGTGTAVLDSHTLAALQRFQTRPRLRGVSIALEYCVNKVLETLQDHPNIEELDISGQILPPDALFFFDGPRSEEPWGALKRLTLDVRARPAILLLENMDAQLQALDITLTCRLLQEECEEVTDVIGKKHSALVHLRIAIHSSFPTDMEAHLDFRRATAGLKKCTLLERLCINDVAIEPLFLEGKDIVDLIRHMGVLQRLELLWPATYMKISRPQKGAVYLEHGISIETLSSLISVCPNLRSVKCSGLTWELPFTLPTKNKPLLVEATWLHGQPELLARIWRRAWPELNIMLNSRTRCCQIIRKARMELAMQNIRAERESV